jgi:hypothetical protein
LYQRLYEAPDPAVPLAAAVGAHAEVTRLQVEQRRLERELADFQTEARGIKNQELTIRRLEERVRVLESELEDKVRCGGHPHPTMTVRAPREAPSSGRVLGHSLILKHCEAV